MYKSLMRLKRNILEHATNTIIQCSAKDPEQMQTGTAQRIRETCRTSGTGNRNKPADRKTRTRSAPIASGNLHKIRIESGRPAAATGYTPRRRGKPLERENTRQGIEHHTGRQTALKSAYIQLSRCRKAQQKSATGSAAPSFSKIEHHVFIYICILIIKTFHIIVNLQTFFFIIKFY